PARQHEALLSAEIGRLDQAVATYLGAGLARPHRSSARRGLAEPGAHLLSKRGWEGRKRTAGEWGIADQVAVDRRRRRSGGGAGDAQVLYQSTPKNTQGAGRRTPGGA